MPQMSPMNWFILFLYFNLTFFMTILKLFFLTKINFLTLNKSQSLSNANYVFLI
uniref:ATP synthase F0 subunit 8 n=1 Tax=Calanus simillimus TaxID=148988 RepID=UPI0020276F48|nr:ATP synthase F0 subunit 8 [Calanus simillimus]UPP55816.1 ATP synthase F0 subunit 8 [Calanus simillimus]